MLNLIAPIVFMLPAAEASPHLTPDQVALAAEMQALAYEYAIAMEKGGLVLSTDQQAKMMRDAISVMQRYLKQGMKLKDVIYAISAGIANAKLGPEYKFILQKWGRNMAAYAYDLYMTLPMAVPEAISPVLYFPFLDWRGSWNHTGPTYTPNDIVHLWVPDGLYIDWQVYPDSYYYEDTDDGGTRVVAAASKVTSQSSSSDSSQPKVKYNSQEVDEDGRWTGAGCFPPLPLPDDYFFQTTYDLQVQCTAAMPDANLIHLDGYYFWAMSQDVNDMETILLVPADVAGYEMAPVSLVVEVI